MAAAAGSGPARPLPCNARGLASETPNSGCQPGDGRRRSARPVHGSAFAGDQRIYAGDYARAADSDLFLITAGLRRKPDESRLDLINRNVALFVQILDSIKSAGLRKDAQVFVVSNPVDILTQLAVQRLGLP